MIFALTYRERPPIDYVMLAEPRMPVKCVGCGYCCLKKTCTFGVQRHPGSKGGRCPELRWNGRRYLCAIMDASRDGSYYRMELRAGAGCLTTLNPWRQVVRERSDDEMFEIRQREGS